MSPKHYAILRYLMSCNRTYKQLRYLTRGLFSLPIHKVMKDLLDRKYIRMLNPRSLVDNTKRMKQIQKYIDNMGEPGNKLPRNRDPVYYAITSVGKKTILKGQDVHLHPLPH